MCVRLILPSEGSMDKTSQLEASVLARMQMTNKLISIH